MAVAPNGRTIWFSNWSSGELTVASLRSRRTVARIRAGDEPHHVAFGFVRLWITDNRGGVLAQLVPDSGRVVRGTAVGNVPHHETVAGDMVLVAVHGSGRVAIVSRAGRLVRSVKVAAARTALPRSRPKG